MLIKEFFAKIYRGRRAQAALEVAIGGMILVGLIGTLISQGWGYSFATYNGYRSMRTALTMSYKYSYGAFGSDEAGIRAMFNPSEDTGYSGSASRMQANVIIVEDRLSPTSLGKFGALNRTPYMVQGGPASHTANLLMPINEPLPGNRPILDVYVNGVHFPFTVADYRTANLYKPGTEFWEKYCLYATNLKTIMILDADGNVNPEFKALGNPDHPYHYNLPFKSVAIEGIEGSGEDVIDINGDYVGPMTTDAGDPMPLPLYGFMTKDSKHVKDVYSITFLPPNKYPDAPFVGCERMYYRQYNQTVGDGWCDGKLRLDGGWKECAHICADERFDLDLSSQMNQEEPAPAPVSRRDPNPTCQNKTNDVPLDLREFFSWQWAAKNAVFDTREDDDTGTFKVKEGIKLRYGDPVRRHDYVDVPGDAGTIGEAAVTGDRDLIEEQILKITKIDKYFGVIEEVLVLDTESGDLDFNANDGQEVGFYFGKGEPGKITVQSPLSMEAQVQAGTTMSVIDTPTQVISSRKKNKVDLISRVIKLSNDTGRFCGTKIVDGEPNPVEVCGGCTTVNKTKTCFESDDAATGGGPAIYVRSIIADERGQSWTADK